MFHCRGIIGKRVRSEVGGSKLSRGGAVPSKDPTFLLAQAKSVEDGGGEILKILVAGPKISAGLICHFLHGSAIPINF